MSDQWGAAAVVGIDTTLLPAKVRAVAGEQQLKQCVSETCTLKLISPEGPLAHPHTLHSPPAQLVTGVGLVQLRARGCRAGTRKGRAQPVSRAWGVPKERQREQAPQHQRWRQRRQQQPPCQLRTRWDDVDGGVGCKLVAILHLD